MAFRVPHAIRSSASAARPGGRNRIRRTRRTTLNLAGRVVGEADAGDGEDGEVLGEEEVLVVEAVVAVVETLAVAEARKGWVRADGKPPAVGHSTSCLSNHATGRLDAMEFYLVLSLNFAMRWRRRCSCALPVVPRSSAC